MSLLSLLSRLERFLGTRARQPGAPARARPAVEQLEARDVPSAGPVVTIDAAWLASHGPGPYLLNQANTTYTLATDVTTPGTAFVVGAANVTLDLNGHRVVYGDAAAPALVNGGFEQGSGRNVPGWDLSGAPAAALAPNTHHLFGSQVLRLTSFASPQRIVSAPVTLPQVGHSYAASITSTGWGQNAAGLTLSVIDAVTGQVLASGTAPDAMRGYAAVVRFVPTTTHAVRLQIDVTPPVGQVVSLDLDGAVLAAADDYGILASGQWQGDVPGAVNLPPAVRNVERAASGFTLKNGSVEQGQGAGFASDPLFFEALPGGLDVENVNTQAAGMDTVSLDANFVRGGVTISNSTFLDDAWNVSDRRRVFASLELNDNSGSILVSGNHLLGSPQVGISIGYNDPNFRVVVSNNEISQNAVVTNGYGILISGLEHFDVSGNTIIPVNGRGIDVDGYSATPVLDGTIRNNYVSVQEHADREYGVVEARALRLRNNVDHEGVQRDLLIEDNTFIATTGPGLAQVAAGVAISYVNPLGAMNGANIVLQNNTIRAIVTTADPTYRAEALLLDGVGAGIGLRVVGNRLESNDVSLALGGPDGGNVADVQLVSNTLWKIATAPARPYTGILAGYWVRQLSDVSILDTRVAGGASSAIVWAGVGAKEVGVGWLLNVGVTGSGGAAAPGALVEVFDAAGTKVFSGVADANGSVQGIPLVTTLYSQAGTTPAVTAQKLGPFRVTATAGGQTVTVFVDPVTNSSLDLTLP